MVTGRQKLNCRPARWWLLFTSERRRPDKAYPPVSRNASNDRLRTTTPSRTYCTLGRRRTYPGWAQTPGLDGWIGIERLSSASSQWPPSHGSFPNKRIDTIQSQCRSAPAVNAYRLNPLIATLKPQSYGPSYSNTVIGTLAIDWWAVTFGTARRGLNRAGPLLAVPTNSPPING